MITVKVAFTQPGFPIGRRGEHQAMQAVIDLSGMAERYGAGTAQLLHQRRGDAVPYLPKLVEQEGERLVWTLTADDTAIAGTGRAEIRWFVGQTLAKSVVMQTTTLPSLGEPGEEPEEVKNALDLLVDKMEHEAVPAGGDEGQVLVKASDEDHDAAWQDLHLPEGLPYGVCETAGAQREKQVSAEGLTALGTGAKLAVKFLHANTVSGTTYLNVNALGTKPIAAASGEGSIREWSDGAVVMLAFDGTHWRMVGNHATTIAFGSTILVDSAESTSDTAALPPAALNRLVAGTITDAPVYDPGTAYAKGARVRYDGQMWTAKTAVPAGAWRQEHWQCMGTIMDMLDSANARIPASGIVDDDGRIQFFNAAGEQIFYIQIPLYDGEVI